MTDKTPIQQAIAFWTERYKEAKEAGAVKTMEAADLFLQYLQAMLSIEKEFAGKVWDASDKRKRYLEKLERGLIVLVGDDEKFPDKQQFIDKYYKP